MLHRFGFDVQIDRLDKAGLLYLVVSRFCDIELHPDVVSNTEMGYIYEELVRRFSEQSNETAGEHFTPREVIRLMVNLVVVNDEEAVARPGVIRTLYDPACGTGGMLSVAEEYLRQLNAAGQLRVYGQELNDETYAVCRSDMMLKGHDAENILPRQQLHPRRAPRPDLRLHAGQSSLRGGVEEGGRPHQGRARVAGLQRPLRRRFERDSVMATLNAVVNEPAPEAAKAGPLSPVISSLLNKDPDQRPSVAAVRQKLTPIAEAKRQEPENSPVIPTPPVDDERRDDSGDTAVIPALPSPSPPGTATTEAAPRGATTTAKAGTEAGRRPTTTVAVDRAVPADWAAYVDPATGYRIAHPPSWQVRQVDRTRTDIRDPRTGSYLRIDWTDAPGPSPVAAWQDFSKTFASRQQDYREVRIEPSTYKGSDAAVWEYTYSSRGGRLHAVNLGMVTGRYGFALNFQTNEELWEGSQSAFEAFNTAFEPAR